MEEKPLWHELIERKNNFYVNFEPLAIYNEPYYEELQGLCEMIEVDIDKLRGISETQILKMIFSRVYNLAIRVNGDYDIFSNDACVYDDVFN